MYRWSWFASQVDSNYYNSVLDIGSGLGVWPYLLSQAGYNVTCVEPNRDSADFIKNKLTIPCTCAFFNPRQYPQYDIVTVIHVLEHMRDPVRFLKDVKRYNLSTTGLVFIEVPDDSEIDYLGWNHDETNSCHFFFFNMTTLSALVEKAGMSIKSSHIVHHKNRDLTRLMVLCENS
jgi:2-polyprenyl-3-methyl-5-hydroxy-6-metoxy-1,4-benzoquinol methylase